MEYDFMQVLTLLLVGLLFAKDTLLPWVGERFFGIKRADEVGDESSQGDRLEAMMGELQLHFNHETTSQNGEIITLLREVRDSQKGMCRKMDVTITMLENQDKYGVKMRKD